MRLGSMKNHFVASLGEFVGTFLFLFLAFAGTQLANTAESARTDTTAPDLQQLMYIALIFGFSLAINVWIFFRISGGLFNPAVTLALCITGNVGPIRSIFIFIAQIVGAIAAAGLAKGLIPGDSILYSTQLGNGTSVAQGLFLEMFLTAELVFTILMLAAEKTKATFVAPVGIGLALFVAELVGVYWTGGSLNPARSFGPAVVTGEFAGTHWIYWVGPGLGAFLATAFYSLMKHLNYEEVNGNQDKTEEEDKIQDMHEKMTELHEHAVENGNGLKEFGSRLDTAGTAGSQRSRRSGGGNLEQRSGSYDESNGKGNCFREARISTSHSPNRSPNTKINNYHHQGYPSQNQHNQDATVRYPQSQNEPQSEIRPSNAPSHTSKDLNPPRSRFSNDRETYTEEFHQDRPITPPTLFGVDGRPYVQDAYALTQERRARRSGTGSVPYREREANMRRQVSARRNGRAVV